MVLLVGSIWYTVMLEPYPFERFKSLQKKTPPHDLHWLANAATHMCWKTHPKQPSAQGAHTTVNEARYADWRVFDRGWLPSTFPKSHLQIYLVAETSETSNTNVQNVAMSKCGPYEIPATLISRIWELGMKKQLQNDKRTYYILNRTKIHLPVAKWSPTKECQKKHHSMWPPAGTRHWLRPVDREISRAYPA